MLWQALSRLLTLGWAIGPHDLLLPMQLAQQYIPFCVASPLQHALAAAWKQAKQNHFFDRQRESQSSKCMRYTRLFHGSN